MLQKNWTGLKTQTVDDIQIKSYISRVSLNKSGSDHGENKTPGQDPIHKKETGSDPAANHNNISI